MKIAIYSRKSKETDTGESIQNQINLCKSYFTHQFENASFEVFMDEGFSGGNTNRPSFKRMMQFAKLKQFDVIGVYKVDRIARNITDFFKIYNELEKNDIKLVSVTEGFDANTPIGRMMMTMLAGFADMERENIKQRVKDNMLELAKLGRWSGGTTPKGYKTIHESINGKKITYLDVDLSEKDLVIEIFKMGAAGFTSGDISKRLKLSSSTVTSIINNPTYLESTEFSKKYLESIGYTVYGELNGLGFLSYNRRPKKKEKKLFNSPDMFVAVSNHESFIDTKTWITANENFRKRGSAPRPRISSNSFLAHMVTCTCGSNMFIHQGHKKKDGTYNYYFKCSAQKNKTKSCSSKTIRVDLLETYVLSTLQKVSADSNLIKNHLNSKNNISETKEKIAFFSQKLSDNQDKISSLSEKLLLLDGEALKIINKKINDISDENNELNLSLLKLEQSLILMKDNSKAAKEIQKKVLGLLNIFDTLSTQERQILIKQIITSISYDGNDSINLNFADVI